MLAGGTKPTAEASVYTAVEFHIFVPLQLFFSTQNVTRSFMN
jgi:hypothetical protein